MGHKQLRVTVQAVADVRVIPPKIPRVDEHRVRQAVIAHLRDLVLNRGGGVHLQVRPLGMLEREPRVKAQTSRWVSIRSRLRRHHRGCGGGEKPRRLSDPSAILRFASTGFSQEIRILDNPWADFDYVFTSSAFSGPHASRKRWEPANKSFRSWKTLLRRFGSELGPEEGDDARECRLSVFTAGPCWFVDDIQKASVVDTIENVHTSLVHGISGSEPSARGR